MVISLFLAFLTTLIIPNVKVERIDFGDKAALAELPLDKLLHVRQALLSSRNLNPFRKYLKGDKTDESTLLNQEDLGVVQDLRTDWKERQVKQKKKIGVKDNTLKRGDWEESGWQGGGGWKGGKGKGDIQTIFQTTITVLAFLAFGGYLLCLIIQSVRGANGAQIAPSVAPAAAIIGRRRKRSPLGEGPDLEKAFDTLRLIAEGYAKYHE